MKSTYLSLVTLITSSGTLLCCVLPAVVAALAGGAAVGTMITAFPWLIPLSQYKGWLFTIAGLLIALDSIWVFWPRHKVLCKLTGGTGCEISSRFSKRVLIAAMILYATGAFFSYALVPLMKFWSTL